MTRNNASTDIEAGHVRRTCLVSSLSFLTRTIGRLAIDKDLFMKIAKLNNYRASPDAAVLRLGGIEIVDLKTNQATWQAPVERWSPTSSLPMKQNAVLIEPMSNGIRAHYMPEGDKSTLFVYEAVTK